MLYPSDRPPRAIQTSVKESAALLTAAMPTIATVSSSSVSTNSDGTSDGQPRSRRLGRAPCRKSMRYAIGKGSMTEVSASKTISTTPTRYTLRLPANRRNSRTVRRKSLIFLSTGGRAAGASAGRSAGASAGPSAGASAALPGS